MASSPLHLNAHAKTNLSLKVLGRREDGFHEVDTIMVRLGLADHLVIRPCTRGEKSRLVCSDDTLPTDEGNLVVRAWRRIEEEHGRKLTGVIELQKNIPVGAGLGGGSSDAAAALRGLNRFHELDLDDERLLELAAELGSDVPFFLQEGACRCTGRGEVLEPLEGHDWELPVVLLKPPYPVTAAEAYAGWESAEVPPGVSVAPQLCPWGEMVNDLERPVFARYLQLAEMKEWLRCQPEVFAPLLSGSGSTMLAVLAAESGGDDLLRRARAEFGDTIWGWLGRTRPTTEALQVQRSISE